MKRQNLLKQVAVKTLLKGSCCKRGMEVVPEATSAGSENAIKGGGSYG